VQYLQRVKSKTASRFTARDLPRLNLPRLDDVNSSWGSTYMSNIALPPQIRISQALLTLQNSEKWLHVSGNLS
jgi:hypothetical protein